MRRILSFSGFLLLAGCATRPQQPAAVVPAVESRPPGAKPLLGLSSAELVREMGRPALQVREGTSLKLQFRSGTCVLDAYLYPSPGGDLRVTYFDTRTPEGSDSDPQACVDALANPS